ncbi:unnamed protein product [Meloidogyne enterolobii]|uniref:Uncharacterized protein n=1 Tax=Meloidogyne enterolobii TaxID=390850 RepID=A0ACB0ZM94_MELEN
MKRKFSTKIIWINKKPVPTFPSFLSYMLWRCFLIKFYAWEWLSRSSALKAIVESAIMNWALPDSLSFFLKNPAFFY